MERNSMASNSQVDAERTLQGYRGGCFSFNESSRFSVGGYSVCRPGKCLTTGKPVVIKESHPVSWPQQRDIAGVQYHEFLLIGEILPSGGHLSLSHVCLLQVHGEIIATRRSSDREFHVLTLRECVNLWGSETEQLDQEVLPPDSFVKARTAWQSAWREVELSVRLDSLQHPNLMRFLDYAEEITDERIRVFLIMPLMSGDLLKVTSDTWSICPAQLEKNACGLFRSVLLGLKEMHQVGVCHRDIKLENCFVDIDGAVRIADFGLACDLTQDGRSRRRCHSAVGTKFLRAPEVWNMNPSGYDGCASDMWSAGLLLFSLVAGTSFHFSINAERLVPMRTAKHDDPGFALLLRMGRNAPLPPMDPGARDLILRLVDPDPETRLTVQQALQHSWLTESPKPAIANWEQKACACGPTRSTLDRTLSRKSTASPTRDCCQNYELDYCYSGDCNCS